VLAIRAGYASKSNLQNQISQESLHNKDIDHKNQHSEQCECSLSLRLSAQPAALVLSLVLFEKSEEITLFLEGFKIGIQSK